PYNFILDTGAPAVFVATAVCRNLGVAADKEKWGSLDRFEIEGGVVLQKMRIRVEDPFQLQGMNGLGLAGAELHGIIGYTILARYATEFDFSKPKLAWTELNFTPPFPEGLSGQTVPTGLDAMANMMKMFGTLLGKKPEPKVVPRGFLGVGLENMDNEVVIKTVLKNSPASVAGLEVGDRIRRFQGKEVGNVADLHRLASKVAPDESAQLTVTRAAKTLVIDIKTGKGL